MCSSDLSSYNSFVSNSENQINLERNKNYENTQTAENNKTSGKDIYKKCFKYEENDYGEKIGISLECKKRNGPKAKEVIIERTSSNTSGLKRHLQRLHKNLPIFKDSSTSLNKKQPKISEFQLNVVSDQ